MPALDRAASEAAPPQIGIVAIGRNEGDRLAACLRSAVGAGATVYVDSGSTDGSQDFARSLGVTVVELAVPPAFTAARARNAGAAALFEQAPETQLIQFVDGDCELQPGWLAAGAAALAADPRLALVFGRRRERSPKASIYNGLADDEWNVPIGEVGACGGDILIRREAYTEVGGYPGEMIAGEEPDMSMRLREAGWRLERIDAEMTLHDAAILRFGQWWTRARRAGHAFAELADRHPGSRSPDWRAVTKRIVVWGGLLPAIALLGLLLAILADIRWLLVPLLLVIGWSVNVLRLYVRRLGDGLPAPLAQASALFLMLGKFPEFLGLLTYRRNRRSGRRAALIEYKK